MTTRPSLRELRLEAALRGLLKAINGHAGQETSDRSPQRRTGIVIRVVGWVLLTVVEVVFLGWFFIIVVPLATRSGP